MEDHRALLGSVLPFSDFSPEELADVLRTVQRRSYRADETIFREGDPPTFLYYVVAGEVMLTLRSEERRVSVGRFGPGRVLAIHTIFDDGPHFLSATASAPTTLLAVPREAVVAPLRGRPDTTFRLAALFARQIRAAALSIAEMQFLDLPVRLAKRILELIETSPPSAAPARAVRVTQRELSELAGATRGGVNRALKRLEHLGIIRIQRGAVVVLSEDRLREMARHEPLPVILGADLPPTALRSAR